MADLERAWHPAQGQFRLAHSLLQGMAELNALYPHRSQGAQEGTVGDTAHRAEGSGSDHNPDANGVVRAWDIDCTGGDFDAQRLANYLQSQMAGNPGLAFFGSRGYVIFNRRITTWTPWGAWVPYYGSDPHTQHIHISVGAQQSEYDSVQHWGLAAGMGHAAPAPKPIPKPAPKPVLPPQLKGLDMYFVRFPNSHPVPQAIYAWDGSYLTWLTVQEYTSLGKPHVVDIDVTHSNIWRAQCTPGTTDPRKQ
jgi:hypothetical protein